MTGRASGRNGVTNISQPPTPSACWSAAGQAGQDVLGDAVQAVQVTDHLDPVAELRVAWQVAAAQPPHAPPLRRQPDEPLPAPGDLLEDPQVGVVAVAPAIAQDQDRGPPGHGIAELLAEPPERRPVV